MPDLKLVLEERAGLPVYGLGPLLSYGVDAFITTRAGGVSLAPYDTLNLGSHVGDDPLAVAENRARVARAADVSDDALIIASQVHGAEALYVEGPSDGLVGDALISDAHDLALAILVADCVPVVLADLFSARFAVVHAGWRGLAAGVLGATLGEFSDPSTVAVIVGPHIDPRRYQVGQEVAEHFAHVPDALTPDASPDDQPRFLLDLGVVTRHQLRQRGVPSSQIWSVHASSSDDEFFSDRHARPCGRFAVVARRANYDYGVGTEA